MDKQWYKDRIYGYQLRIIQELSTRLHTEPKRTVLKSCRQILMDFSHTVHLTVAQSHSIWNWTVNTYSRMSKISWGDKAKIPEAATKQYRAMEKEKNQIADDIEFNFKHDWATHLTNVFYRCSTHSNCADGHKAYQGRVYINKDLASAEELEYAESHDIMDIKEAMSAPIWLFTRRNCKHILTPVSSELVMTNTLPPQKIIIEEPLDSPYRAYYDRKKLLIAAGLSKKNDSYKRTVLLMKKYKLR